MFACGQTGGGAIKKFIRINEKIRVPEVRLIGAEGNQLGIVSTDKPKKHIRAVKLVEGRGCVIILDRNEIIRWCYMGNHNITTRNQW